MNNFSIALPIGHITIRMGLSKAAECFTRQVVSGESVHVHALEGVGAMIHTAPLPRETTKHKTYKLKPTLIMSPLMLATVHPKEISEKIRQAITAVIVQKLQDAVAKKPVEFYVPDLTLEKVEELSYKFMDNMGSDNAMLCIFQLSPYHKFAAFIDYEAFRFYMNEDGMHGELIEIYPHKWVLGRYDNDLTMIKQMEGMRRYSPGG